MEWVSFFLGWVIGSIIITLLVAIANTTEETRMIIRELACCEALKKCKEKR